jgi:tape measure domain-containing protein
MGVGLGGAERVFAGVATGAGAATAAIAALAAATVAAGVAVARAGDQTTESLARLQAATGSIAAAEAAYQGLYRLSQQTGVAVSESAGAFARFALAAREVGATNDQVLALVRTVQQAGIVAGASTQETTSTVMQLGQALASGKLQGDELRSILENMPTLAEALARQLGIGVGELRKMGEEGKLTADVVLPALLRAGERINAEFEKLPPTMGRSFSILGEAMTRFAADLDRALGLSQAIARAAQAAAAAVDRTRVAVGLGTPEETARAGQAAAQQRLANADRQAAEIERTITALEANPRRTVPEDAILETLRRQAAPLRADRERAVAELERFNREVEEIEREALVRRLGEQEAADRQRAEGQRRRDEASLGELRKALDRERSVREEHAARIRDIDALLSRGAVEAAEAQRLRAAADRERDDALQRLGATARETARQVREVEYESAPAGQTVFPAAAVQAAQIRTADQQERREAEAHRSRVRAMDDARREVERFEQQSRDAVARIGETAFERIGQGLVNAFTSGGKAALDFGSLARSVLASMAADLAKLGLVNPLANAVFGTMRPTLAGAASSLGAGGQEGLGGLSSLGSVLGLGGIGTSISGLLGAPLFGQAALSSATSNALGAMGGAYGPATAAQLGLGGVTVGSALGALGLGFGAGTLLNSLAGGKQTGGMIGSGAGAAAGALIGSIIPGIGTVLGGLIGGAGGGLLGGMFGPRASNREGNASFDFASGAISIGGQTGRKFSQANRDAAAAAAQQVRDLVAGIATAIGGSIGSGSFTIGVGDRDGVYGRIAGAEARRYGRDEAGLQALVGDLVRGLVPGITGGLATELRTALGTAGANTPQAILDIAGWLGSVYRPLTEIQEPLDAFTTQLRALNKTYDDAITRARNLGLSEQALNEGRTRAIAELERQRRDAMAPQVTGVVASLADYARGLRVANDNPLTPTARLGLASSQFDADLTAALGGDFRAVSRIQGSADTLLSLSRDVYGSGQGFAATFDRVLAGIGGIADLGDDRLTASALAAETRSQTETLVDALARLQAEVTALRREVQQAGANPLAARAA